MKTPRFILWTSLVISIAANLLVIVLIYLYPSWSTNNELADSPAQDGPDVQQHETEPPEPKTEEPKPKESDDSPDEAAKPDGEDTDPEEPEAEEPKEPDLDWDEAEAVEILKQKVSIENIVEDTMEFSQEKQMYYLNKLVPKVEAYDIDSTNAISDRVEKKFDVPKRAYEPVEGLKGEPDLDSLIPYDYEIVEKDGQRIFRETLVDKDGRSFVLEKPKSEMTFADQTNYKLFRRAGRNSSLRKVINTALGIVDQKLQDTAPQNPEARPPKDDE